MWGQVQTGCGASEIKAVHALIDLGVAFFILEEVCLSVCVTRGVNNCIVVERALDLKLRTGFTS